MSTLTALFVLTAYGYGCDCKHGNPTKSGIMPVAELTVSADLSVLPIGSIVEIEGLGSRMVHDTGGGVKGKHVDIFMTSCEEARKFGRQKRLVTILHIPQGKR
jgi:3D (Asp-Asp-Asp) domain-containing protein